LRKTLGRGEGSEGRKSRVGNTNQKGAMAKRTAAWRVAFLRREDIEKLTA